MFGGNRIGDMSRVQNEDRRFGASESYLHIRVKDENDEEVNLLFTDHEISEAKFRASRNQEDFEGKQPGIIQSVIESITD